ncbi:MAG: Nramp family divalent metal transporter [Bacteroidota bacterium]
MTDPYLPSEATILEAPTAFKERLKHLGPSLILSAAIVGSGELIATTALGAKAGFTLFWIIFIGCLIKVAVQLEFGKHTILTGETAMQAFNQLPGPKFGKANWSVWGIFIMMLLKLFQLGGIVGGVAIILQMVLPVFPVSFYAIFAALITSALVFRGYYRMIEKLAIYMIFAFTVFTLTSLYSVSFTEYAFTFGDVLSGMSFSLPKEMVLLAIGAFGITGVGGDEIIQYNYWCLEKGYAAYVGPKPTEQSGQNYKNEWAVRAKGWIKVMHLDASIALVIYTVVTAAFYLLGASILHRQGIVPEGFTLIEHLSKIYTLSLGAWAKYVFLAGAFVVLYSTLFAACASWTRQYSDIFGQLGWIDFFDFNQRKKSIAILAWAMPLIWAILFIFINLPVLMVISGGIIGSFILILVVVATINFRYVRQPAEFRPSKLYDLILLLSIVSIFSIAVYGLVQFIF